MHRNFELLNRTSSRIVRVAAAYAASGIALEFRIVLQSKVKIKHSKSSVYSRLNVNDAILYSVINGGRKKEYGWNFS